MIALRHFYPLYHDEIETIDGTFRWKISTILPISFLIFNFIMIVIRPAEIANVTFAFATSYRIFIG